MSLSITVDGVRAVLNCPPNATVLRLLGQLEGRRRWIDGAQLVMEATDHNIKLFVDNLPGLEVRRTTATDTVFLGAGAAEAASWAEAFVPKVPHLPHQKIALAKSLAKPDFALFMEQGTGKTKVAIDHATIRHRHAQITGVLVIALNIGIARQWVNSQLPTHSADEFVGIIWHPGRIKEMMRRASQKSSKLTYFCMNIDAIKTKAGKAAALEFTDAHKSKLMMIVDESHSIKNPSSERWKAADELGKDAKHKMLMTGTPIARNLQDEWAQLKWLNQSIIGIKYISAFRNEYCIMGGYEGREVVGHRNVERFKKLVEPWSFRITAEEIGVMPPVRERWRFDLTEEQRTMIKKLKETFLAQLTSGAEYSSENPAVIFSKCQQIANGFLIDQDGVVHRLMPPQDNPRVQALMDILEARPGKTIVWCKFNEDLRIVQEVLGADCVAYTSDMKPGERQEAADSFLSKDGPRVFLSTASTGGTGLNLQGDCLTTAFYSNSDNSIDRWQAEFRNNRLGTNGIVTIYDLVAKGSADVRILASHRNKKMISQMALDDIIDMLKSDWDKE